MASRGGPGKTLGASWGSERIPEAPRGVVAAVLGAVLEGMVLGRIHGRNPEEFYRVVLG